MILRWLLEDLNMYPDVARLLTRLATVDGIVSFGSPLTPVLCTMVHRRMFDLIAQVCDNRSLRLSLWVDDLTISGNFVPGIFVDEIREIIRLSGLKSHKIRFLSGSKPTFITGIGIVGKNLIAPNALHLRIKNRWHDLYEAETDMEKDDCIQSLLNLLGTLRHIVGAKSIAGQKAANQMHSLRQKREKIQRESSEKFNMRQKESSAEDHFFSEAPF